MSDEPIKKIVKFERPIHWDKQLRPDEAEREIKRISEDSNNVIIGKHAFERVRERGTIYRPDVDLILKDGVVTREPTKNKEGYWEVIITRAMKGSSRECAAVTIIFHDQDRLFVKTVQWMDLK